MKLIKQSSIQLAGRTTICKLHFRIFILWFCILSFITLTIKSQTVKQIESTRISFTKRLGYHSFGEEYPVRNLPLNIAVSSSKKLIAVTNNGESDQYIQLIDALNYKVLDTIITGKSWMGLTFSQDEKYLFASGGNDNWIMRYGIVNNKLVPKDTIVLGKPWPCKNLPAGIAYDDKKQLLYIVTKEDNSLYVTDVSNKKVLKRFDLGGEGYTCLLSHKEHKLYISCWGCRKVIIFDTEKQAISSSITVEIILMICV